MTVDPVAFSFEWAVLQDRFRVKHTDETASRYFDILDAELTTDEFRTACGKAFRFETFFPSPQKLIDHARGDFHLQALAAWDAMMDRNAKGEPATLPGTPERTLLNRMGLAGRLRELDYRDLDFAKREFILRYRAHLEETASQNLALPATPAKELPNARN